MDKDEELKKSLISVIIPCYNCERFINECIESVINQSYKNLEIICVNDGSTDSTLKKLNSLQDKRIRIINQENMGVSTARNQGMGVMKGKYYIFVDADDTMDLNMIEVLLKNKNSDDTLVTADRCHWDGIDKKTNYFSKKYRDNKDFRNYTVGPVARLYTSKYKIKFKDGVIFEDRIHFIECIKKYRNLNFTFDSVYNYRIEAVRKTSITSIKRTKKEYMDAWNEISIYYKDFGLIVRQYAFLIFEENKGMIWKWKDKRFFKAMENIKDKSLVEKLISILSKLKLYFVIKLMLLIIIKKRKFDA